MTRNVSWLVVSCVAISALMAGSLRAQVEPITPILLDSIENLDFDRPESWAMKYFTSVSLFSGLGTPRRTQPGSLELAFEGGTVPNLGAEKRRVGFIGSKVEDLNRTSLFGRFRATFGLPGDLSLTVGFTPPVELDGVTPKIFNLALARPLFDTKSWRLGLRLHGQLGSLKGDLTCPKGVVSSADPQVNPDGCLEPSSDKSNQNYVGLELSVTPKIWGDRWEPHFAVSANHMDLKFQVRARYSIFEDEAQLFADGFTYALTAGLNYRLSEVLEVRSAVFYTPLDVIRDPARGSQNDALINGRILVAYSLR